MHNTKLVSDGTFIYFAKVATSTLLFLLHSNNDGWQVLVSHSLETTSDCFWSTFHGFLSSKAFIDIFKSRFIYSGADSALESCNEHSAGVTIKLKSYDGSEEYLLTMRLVRQIQIALVLHWWKMESRDSFVCTLKTKVLLSFSS